jgi:general stress protein CsbA
VEKQVEMYLIANFFPCFVFLHFNLVRLDEYLCWLVWVNLTASARYIYSLSEITRYPRRVNKVDL